MHDRYKKAQKKAHAAAIETRKKKAEEAAQRLGDPVRGIQTDYVRSFSEPIPPPSFDADSSAESSVVNFRVPVDRLQKQLHDSKALTEIPEQIKDPTYFESDDKIFQHENNISNNEELGGEFARKAEANLKQVQIAMEAVNRITSFDLASSKDRLKRNVDRCIEKFGRHNTDKILPSKNGKTQVEKFRAGNDTGSSEVQIAILTAKINNLATALQSTGRKDKHNKRNLQLFVHKRQKMLRYLRRKEQGGPRWQNLINTLGLTEATWQGQINI